MFSFIPENVLLDKNLSSNSKLLYGVLNGFISNNKRFYASNANLSETLNVSQGQIRRLWNELYLAKLIKVKSKGKRWDVEIVKKTTFEYEESSLKPENKTASKPRISVQNCTESDKSVQNCTESVQKCTASVQNCTDAHLYISNKLEREERKKSDLSLSESIPNYVPDCDALIDEPETLTEMDLQELLVNHCDGNKEYLDYHVEMMKNHISAKALEISDLKSYAISWIMRNKVSYGDTPATFKQRQAKRQEEEKARQSETQRPIIANQKPRKQELVTDSKGRTVVRFLD